MYLYQRIRDLREDNDLNQSEIGKILGIDRSVYGLYELGKRQFPLHQVIELAKFYKVSIDYLVGLTDDPTPPKRK